MLRRLQRTDLSVPLSRTEQFAIMVVGVLDELWQAPCCPSCCAQCAVLANLLVAGDLDWTVLQAPPEMIEDRTWFRGNRVQRAWLYGQWEPGEPNCVCTPDKPAPGRPSGKACPAHRKARKKCTCRQEPEVSKNPAAFLAA